MSSIKTFGKYIGKGKLFPGENDRNTTRKTINRKLVTFIEVLALDVFGEIEKPVGDYISKISIDTENHATNLIELPF